MATAAPTPIAAGRTQLVVGFGGTTRAHSSTNRALALALEAVNEAGLRTQFFGGDFLAGLPHYRPETERTPEARTFVEAVRAADGVVIATPGYHGGVSGLVKNAIDLLEDIRDDAVRTSTGARWAASLLLRAGRRAARRLARCG